MVQSMTGYGRHEKRYKDISVTVEIKSLNHRYIDINLRIPRVIRSYDIEARRFIKAAFSRGYFDVTIELKSNRDSDKRLCIDEDTVKQYIEVLRATQKRFKLSGDIDINSLIKIDGLFYLKEKEDASDDLWEHTLPVFSKAVSNLKAMRDTEGRALNKDMLKQVSLLKKHVNFIKKKRRSCLKEIHDSIAKSLSELLDGHSIDDKRILEETSIIADRSDITEELIRLENHIARFTCILKEKNPVGRKLDFLAQELNREANTIASKSVDYGISDKVIDIKSGIEKIREQVQNIE